jgi:hypothetical protein
VTPMPDISTTPRSKYAMREAIRRYAIYVHGELYSLTRDWDHHKQQMKLARADFPHTIIECRTFTDNQTPDVKLRTGDDTKIEILTRVDP